MFICGANENDHRCYCENEKGLLLEGDKIIMEKLWKKLVEMIKQLWYGYEKAYEWYNNMDKVKLLKFRAEYSAACKTYNPVALLVTVVSLAISGLWTSFQALLNELSKSGNSNTVFDYIENSWVIFWGVGLWSIVFSIPVIFVRYKRFLHMEVIDNILAEREKKRLSIRMSRKQLLQMACEH